MALLGLLSNFDLPRGSHILQDFHLLHLWLMLTIFFNTCDDLTSLMSFFPEILGDNKFYRGPWMKSYSIPILDSESHMCQFRSLPLPTAWWHNVPRSLSAILKLFGRSCLFFVQKESFLILWKWPVGMLGASQQCLCATMGYAPGPIRSSKLGPHFEPKLALVAFGSGGHFNAAKKILTNPVCQWGPFMRIWVPFQQRTSISNLSWSMHAVDPKKVMFFFE